MNFNYSLLDSFYTIMDSLVGNSLYTAGIYTIVEILKSETVHDKFCASYILRRGGSGFFSSIRIPISEHALKNLFDRSLIEEYHEIN